MLCDADVGLTHHSMTISIISTYLLVVAAHNIMRWYFWCGTRTDLTHSSQWLLLTVPSFRTGVTDTYACTFFNTCSCDPLLMQKYSCYLLSTAPPWPLYFNFSIQWIYTASLLVVVHSACTNDDTVRGTITLSLVCYYCWWGDHTPIWYTAERRGA